MRLLKVTNSLHKFFFCLNFTNFVDTLASRSEWLVSFLDPGALVGLSVLNKYWRPVGSSQWWLCLQGAEGGNRRVVPGGAVQALWAGSAQQWRDQTDHHEHPILWVWLPVWSQKPPPLVSWVRFADALCVFERLAAENKSTENLSVASDLEATDTPKSKRSAIRSVVDGARRRGWAARTHQLGKGTQTHHQMQSSGFASFSYQINSLWISFFPVEALKFWLICSANVDNFQPV